MVPRMSRGRASLSAVLVLAAAIVLACVTATPTLADPSQSPAAAADHPPRTEVWTGAEIFRTAWSVYAGGTWAPAAGIGHDGWRVRAVAGTGGYDDSTRTHHGTVVFADLLAGYHWQLGSLTLKAFAGLTVSDIAITPFDPATRIQGRDAGGKIAVETWWNASERLWLSLDAAWASLYDTSSARFRLGWRLTPGLSLGAEASFVGNEEGGAIRLGPLVRYEWARGEISLAAGFASDSAGYAPWATAPHSATPFATVNWLTRF